MLLRVIISPQDIRKVRLFQKICWWPETGFEKKNGSHAPHLTFNIKMKTFLASVTSRLDDLPKDKVTLKVHFCFAVTLHSSSDINKIKFWFTISVSINILFIEQPVRVLCRSFTATANSLFQSHLLIWCWAQAKQWCLQKRWNTLSISRDMKSEVLVKKVMYSFKA